MSGLLPTHDEAKDLSLRHFAGTAAPASAILQSPASGRPCVHWRLRITESLGANVLIHDVAAEEAFELENHVDPELPPQRLRIDGRRATVDAVATTHVPDSEGARAVANAFGLVGALCVEEILIPLGARLEVEGVVVGGEPCGPFRSARPEAALEHVTVRMPGPLRRTALLPWALGTSAALLGVLGAAGAILRRVDPAPGAKALMNFVMRAEVNEPHPTPARWP